MSFSCRSIILRYYTYQDLCPRELAWTCTGWDPGSLSVSKKSNNCVLSVNCGRHNSLTWSGWREEVRGSLKKKKKKKAGELSACSLGPVWYSGSSSSAESFGHSGAKLPLLGGSAPFLRVTNTLLIGRQIQGKGPSPVSIWLPVLQVPFV